MNFLKKHLHIILAIVILAIIIFVPEFTFAADAPKSTWTDMLHKLTTLLSFAIYIIYPITWIAIVFIGLFMDNEFLFSGGIQDVLISTWRMIRDLVNIGFVAVLLLIALYNVTGISFGSAEALEFKTALKKFVLAVILVNFSFFGTKVIIDVANVLTVGIFAIPNDIINNEIKKGEDASGKNYICYEEILGVTTIQNANSTPDQQKLQAVVYNPKESTITPFTPADPNWTEVNDLDAVGTVVAYQAADCQVPTDITIDLQKLISTSDTGKTDWNEVIKFNKYEKLDPGKNFGSHDIALILAENILKLRTIPNIGLLAVKDDTQKIDALLQIFLKGAFGIIFMVLYGIGFILVAITLLGRAIYIWAFMCLSPIIALLTSLEGFAGIQSEVQGLSIKKFIDYAFIPVKVALVTSLAFLLIFKFNAITREDYVMGSTGQTTENPSCPPSQICLNGPHSSLKATVITAGVFSNFNDVRQIPFHLIVVFILYVGIQWATKDTIVSGFTDKIWGAVKQWGEHIPQIGLHAVSIPYYAGDNNGMKRFDLVESYRKFTNGPGVWQGEENAKKPLDEAINGISSKASVNSVLEKNTDNFLNAPESAEQRNKLGRQMLKQYQDVLKEKSQDINQKTKIDMPSLLNRTDFSNPQDMINLITAVSALKGVSGLEKETQEAVQGLYQAMGKPNQPNLTRAEVESWYSKKTADTGIDIEKERNDTKGKLREEHKQISGSDDYKNQFKPVFQKISEEEMPTSKDVQNAAGTGEGIRKGINAIYNITDNTNNHTQLTNSEIQQMNALAPDRAMNALNAINLILTNKKKKTEINSEAYQDAVAILKADPQGTASKAVKLDDEVKKDIGVGTNPPAAPNLSSPAAGS
ncbi:hypothetical protein A2272_02765 [Candidatus Peregrinibacteria bacterium RIFOXYA12_FULL_33_12]|nr:MAG: hypothetical protein A2272_02765 [Candidatus Peregrinibacteria bacterium RIFOXYA12_FULL_33_12]OGJ45240.1 MAG: hypothetical protein A2263_06740 [Candidatus Peregrinibacteria bacterium RIFOXYA2_FULL_33_21]OGJ51164.1 MAG: hypothetical protein A2307_04825 [Candidatus Peregrinibacteria bacterium RIFOXYB2_FULL_33_20]